MCISHNHREGWLLPGLLGWKYHLNKCYFPQNTLSSRHPMVPEFSTQKPANPRVWEDLSSWNWPALPYFLFMIIDAIFLPAPLRSEHRPFRHPHVSDDFFFFLVKFGLFSSNHSKSLHFIKFPFDAFLFIVKTESALHKYVWYFTFPKIRPVYLHALS